MSHVVWPNTNGHLNMFVSTEFCIWTGTDLIILNSGLLCDIVIRLMLRMHELHLHKKIFFNVQICLNYENT